MNYRFSLPSCCFAALLCLSGVRNASAQVPDSLPHPDSLSDQDASVLMAQLTSHAKLLEAELSQQALHAGVARDTAELNWVAAKQDTLSSKAALDSLGGIAKTAKNVEKTAQKRYKQASQTLVFVEKVANMDAANQRKNLRKAWKQLRDLDRSVHPPPPPVEKPIAEIIGAQGVGEPPAPPAKDSAAATELPSGKRNNKEKKPEKMAPKYKPYDPADDVLLNPPRRPCQPAVSTRDEFSGETYREMPREELFRFTNDVMKKILSPAQPHILCEAALSAGGANAALHLIFNIRDANARKAFGNLAKNSIAILKFLDGTTFTVNNLRSDDGAADASGQVFTYRAQYALDPAAVKKIRKTELDKIRITWSTGYEDYDIQSVDLLMRQAKCLFD